MNEAVNIAEDEKIIDCLKTIGKYCAMHKDCKNCILIYADVCTLKWRYPKNWEEAAYQIERFKR